MWSNGLPAWNSLLNFKKKIQKSIIFFNNLISKFFLFHEVFIIIVSFDCIYENEGVLILQGFQWFCHWQEYFFIKTDTI